MPTTTYTPTATFRTTGLVQANGDVSDADTLQNCGKYAMDSIAYLTGSNTRTQVSRIQTCTDLTALKAIGSSDRRDLDFCVLDTANGERLYKFDSGSSSTGDDYAVVTPASGTGRWHLVGAKPSSTTHRWLVGTASIETDVTANNATKSIANGRIVCTGGNATLYAEFNDFNVGDVITSVELAADANVGGGGANAVAAFYLMSAALAATTPTMTLLGTVTITAGSGATNSTVSAAPLPVTLATGQKVIVQLTCNTAIGVTDYIYWVALNGTRSYITE